MKKVLLLLLIKIFIYNQNFAQNKPAYHIKLNVKGLQDSTCYLAHFYLNAKSQIIKDTSVCDKNGNIEFIGETKLPEGIYIISIGKSNSVQLVVGSEPEVELTADTTYEARNIKVIKSTENANFLEYQNTMSDFNIRFKEVSELKNGKIPKDANESIKQIQKNATDFQDNFFLKNKGTLTAKLLKAPQQPQIPESPKLANGKIDSTFALRWIQQHYFDNLDLSNELFIRTPFLESKIDYYLDNLNYQIPDSLNKASDFIMNKAKPTKTMQKYLASHIASRYERPSFMGGDAVFVHMAEKYFIGMPALWDSATLAPIEEKKIAVKNVLIGTKAQNATLTDTTGNKLLPLYDVKAKYTLMFIYDPDCGHCKERAPKILDFYNKMKKYDLKVYAPSTINSPSKQVNFIKTLKTQEFINVYDKLNVTDFRKKYNVFTTPQVMLLDRDKKIIGRGLDETQMEDLIMKLEKEAAKKL